MTDDLHTNQAPVEDSLRTRIAAAIDRRYNDEAIGHTYEVCLHAADAVIREMKMVRRSSFISEDGSRIAVSEWERSRMKTPANGWQNQYVTEWTADE